jgi:hypothetical protein
MAELTTQDGRQALIKEIANSENVKRKAFSLRQTEIYGDYLYNHVWDNIAGRFSEQTAREMPICAHINLARSIVKNEACIYKEEPQRTYSETTDEQSEVVDRIYKDMMANAKFMRANESFKLQQQCHVMVVPKDGKLQMRVLRNHHIDAIPDPDNPEEAMGYIIHNFDRQYFTNSNRKRDSEQHQYGDFNQFTNQRNDAVDQVIGDEDDWMSTNSRYLVWTKEFNFIMNGKGEIVSDMEESPIPGVLPIVDISQEKDFTYWVNQGDAIVDATVDYNVTLSDIGYICQQTGFGQAYMISQSGAQTPESMQIGPNTIIRMEVEPGSDITPEFGFATPNSDITGCLQYANDKLVAFLTSRGLDPDVITTETSGGASSSGVQEFLRMMKHFKASKEDYSTFEYTEQKVFQIIKAWHNLAPELLADKYKTSQLSEDTELMIQFAGPEMLQTEQEKVDVWSSKVENGFASRIDAIAALEGIDREEAEERIKEIDGDEQIGRTINEISDVELEGNQGQEEG